MISFNKVSSQPYIIVPRQLALHLVCRTNPCLFLSINIMYLLINNSQSGKTAGARMKRFSKTDGCQHGGRSKSSSAEPYKQRIKLFEPHYKKHVQTCRFPPSLTVTSHWQQQRQQETRRPLLIHFRWVLGDVLRQRWEWQPGERFQWAGNRRKSSRDMA